MLNFSNVSVLIFLLPFYTLTLLAFGGAAANVNTTDTLHPETKTFIQKYNLTSKQIKSLNQIQNQYAEQLQQLNDKLKQDDKEFTKLMMGEASSEEISLKYNQLQNRKQQAAQLYLKKCLAIREVLTPAQRHQLGENISRPYP